MLVARQAANATATPKPKCGENKTLGDYSLSLHTGAVFIILGVSFSACAFPLFVVKAPKLRILPTFLFNVRHFGTGVLIATAFVHLLPTAFLSLTDQCLPKFWNEDFPAMAGALAMAAVFMIAVVEMVFSPVKNCCALPVGMMEGNNSMKARRRERKAVMRRMSKEMGPRRVTCRQVLSETRGVV
jgi:hypothetical protein